MPVSDKALEKIASWPWGEKEDVLDWLSFCAAQWDTFFGSVKKYAENGEGVVEFMTGGWSENKTILSAMRRNGFLWMASWHSSYRGGRHKFSVPLP